MKIRKRLAGWCRFLAWKLDPKTPIVRRRPEGGWTVELRPDLPLALIHPGHVNGESWS
jgi:hypothetical protein